MEYHEFKGLIHEGIATYGIALNEPEVEKLHRYFQELKHWSKKINLIARETGDKAIVEKHFIDSLALLTLLDEQRDCLLDIGSGAGFPGLVCKIARPRMAVSLVEPRMKRVSFLKHVCRTCGINGITIQSCRLEEGVSLEDEKKFNCVVSRAVSDISKFLSICERFCEIGKRVICMKGPKFREEIECISETDTIWKLVELSEYNLPFSHSSRALVSFTASRCG